jgi:hypothetical protein
MALEGVRARRRRVSLVGSSTCPSGVRVCAVAGEPGGMRRAQGRFHGTWWDCRGMGWIAPVPGRKPMQMHRPVVPRCRCDGTFAESVRPAKNTLQKGRLRQARAETLPEPSEPAWCPSTEPHSAFPIHRRAWAMGNGWPPRLATAHAHTRTA